MRLSPKSVFIIGLSTFFIFIGKSSTQKPSSYLELFTSGDTLAHKVAEYKQIFELRSQDVAALDADKKSKKGKEKKKGKEILTYEVALKNLDVLLSSASTEEKEKAARYVLELDYSVQNEGGDRPLKEGWSHATTILKTWSVPKSSPPSAEAKNLESSSNTSDLSTLNPKADSLVWKNPGNLEQIDLDQYFYGNNAPLYKGTTVEFPTGAVYLKEIHKKQTSGKLDVFTKDGDKKNEYSFKMFKETHADPTVSALQSLIGYHTDTMKHVSNVKVYLPQGMSIKDFKADFLEYYRPESISVNADLKNFIVDEGSDAEGTFITFRDGEFEARPKNLARVGEWHYSKLLHDQMREVRALLVFNYWISNTDMHSYVNNKLLMRKDTGEIFLLQHDSSRALGGMLPEKADVFSAHLIDGSLTGSKINFNYRASVTNPLRDKVTYNDARWIARLIGRITRTQIQKAVSYGGFPESIAKIYVEKLINRRNELVEAFGLSAEVGMIACDPKLTTANGDIKNGKVIKSKYEGVSQDFGNYPPSIANIVGRMLKYPVISGAQLAVGQINGYKYTTSGVELGFSDALVTEAILNIGRTVTENQHPTSENDRYLVEDDYKVGIRLGAGVVVQGTATATTQFRLVYPVRTRDDGIKGIVDFTLPFHVMAEQLPPHSVLMVENYIQGGGRLKIPSYGVVSIGGDASIEKVGLSRRVIDQKSESDGKIVLHEDNSSYIDKRARALLRLFGTVSLPVAETSAQTGGSLDGRTYILTSGEASSTQGEAAISSAIWPGNFSKVAAFKKPVDIDATFKRSSTILNLLGFYRSEKRADSERLSVGQDSKGSKFVQHRSYGSATWSWLDNGETQEARIYAIGPKDGQAISEDNTTVDINFAVHDIDTRTEELKFGYFNLGNALALDKDFVKLQNPELFSRDQKWGTLDSYVNVEYCGTAVSRILNVSDDAYWDAVATILQMPLKGENSVEAARNGRRYTFGSAQRKVYPNQDIIGEAGRVLSIIRQAAKAQSAYAKLELLIRAIRTASSRSEYTFNPTILSMLNLIAGTNNYFVSAVYTPPRGESEFPGNDPLVSQRGKVCSGGSKQLLLFPMDSLELYNMFNRFDGSQSPKVLDVHLRK